MKYQVFLEVGQDGRAMAHVPQLPGCMAPAPTREGALAAIPGAIREYLRWLVRHGEEVTVETAEIEIAEEIPGFGPFDPGDKAALFPPDREPLTREEMVTLFRLMGYSRDDLLALIEDVPEEVLVEEYTEGWSIERILYHIGGAETWYVSRIDHTWEFEGYEQYKARGDVMGWLHRTREAALARLKRLSRKERSTIYYPSHYTDHPDEAWTARKVFRRFLEHEREHRAQIEAILKAHGV